MKTFLILQRSVEHFLPIVPVDLELLCAVHSLEGAEALQKIRWEIFLRLPFEETLDGDVGSYLQWHFAGSCDKLKELGSVSLVKASQSTPEPA